MKYLYYLVDFTATIAIFFSVFFLIRWIAESIHIEVATFLTIFIFYRGTHTFSDPITNYICNYFNLERP